MNVNERLFSKSSDALRIQIAQLAGRSLFHRDTRLLLVLQPFPLGCPGGLQDLAQGFNPGLCTQIGETADIWKSSFMVRIDTGWKPMLRRRVRRGRSRGDGCTA